jgi:hypothetical protein
MARAKAKADHRADTRGGAWAGIPLCVIESDAYRDLSLWARSILVELVARMNGYNNGEIAMSVSEITIALNNSNRGAIARGIAELVSHGLIDVSADAVWKRNLARQFRLTFVNTTSGGRFVAATNEYRNWVGARKSGGNSASPRNGLIGNGASLPAGHIGNGALPRLLAHKRKSAKNAVSANGHIGNGASLLIDSHTPAPKRGRGKRDHDTDAAIRERLIVLLRASPAGTQSRLAGAARIPGGTLSKFKSGDLPALSSAHRVRLLIEMTKFEGSVVGAVSAAGNGRANGGNRRSAPSSREQPK